MMNGLADLEVVEYEPKPVEYIVQNLDYDIPVKVELHMNHNGIILEPELKISNNLFDSQLEDLDIVNVDNDNEIITDKSHDEIFFEAVHQLATSTQIIQSPKLSGILQDLKCPICDTEYKTIANLFQHIKLCSKGQYQCNICADIYTEKVHLNNHLVCHAVERPCACRICGTLFIHIHELHDHMLVHGRVTNQAIPVKEELSQLPEIRKRRKYVRRKPLTNSRVVVNGTSTGNERLQPEICRRLGSPNKSPKMIKPHKCRYCSKMFAREKALLNHVKLHKSGFNNTYECQKCNLKFTDSLTLDNHLCRAESEEKSNHSKDQEIEEENEMKVKQRGNKKVNKKDDQQQVVPHRRVQTNKSKKVFYNNYWHVGRFKQGGKIYTYNCTGCSRYFMTKKKIIGHLCKIKKSIYICKICPISFTEQKLLDRHCYMKHKNIMPSKRGRPFGSTKQNCLTKKLDALNSSQEEASSKKKQPAVQNRNNLQKQQPQQSPNKSKPAQVSAKAESSNACPLCSKTFNQKVVLTEHIRWIHTANLTPNTRGTFQCPICKKTSSNRAELNVHFIGHCNSTPTTPSKEPKKFLPLIESDDNDDSNDSDNIPLKKIKTLPKARAKRKLRKISKVEETKPLRRTTRNSLPKQSVRRKLYNNISRRNCDNTKKKTSESPRSKKEIAEVINSIVSQKHTDDESVECDLCGITFTNRNKLVEHIAVHF